MKKYLPLVILIFIFSNKSFGQWHLTNGPTGGFVNCLTTDGNKIFTGGFGYIFSSSDSGITWNALDMTLGTNVITCVAVDGNNIYAGSYDGLYYSSDHGLSWVITSRGTVSLIAANATSIYYGGLGGLYKSINHGITFTIPDSDLYMKNISALASDQNNIYAGTDSGIYISNDNGLTWNFSDSILATLRIYSIYIHNSDLFTITSNGVFISHDNGISWNPSNTGLNSNLSCLTFIGTTIFASANSQIYTSIDNGMSWQSISSNGLDPLISSICMNSMGNKLILGCYDGLHSSVDGGMNWISCNTGLVNDGGLHFAGSGNNLFVQTESGRLAVSHDEGNSWTDISFSPNEPIVYAVVANSTFAVAGTDSEGVFVSYDNGFNWNQQNTGLSNLQVFSLAIDGNNIYAETDAGIYASNDNASTWHLRNSLCCGYSMAAENNKMLINLFGDLYYSQDTGYNWTIISSISNPGLDGGAVGINNGRLFAGIPLTPNQYSDDGIHWTAFPFIANGIYSFYFKGDNAFAVAPGYGIGYSPDNGITWTRIDSTLYDYTVSSVCIDDENIFADAELTGVWGRSLNEILGINNPQQSNSEINIYPNPSTGIFNLLIANTEEKIIATIYDIAGNQILKTNINSGHSGINLSGYPKGIYFINAIGKNKIYNEKLIVE